MSFIYIPFSYIMKACVWISQNSYLFGLFFFALVFELLLFPLAIKQQKSQIAMAKIRPKEYAIRKKYAGRTDRVTQQKMQMEIQEMQQAEGYNPLSGCLPMLIQLPLIFILYSIVRYPIQYSSDFTQQAEDNITTVITTMYENDGYDSEDIGFETVISQYAFEYAENIREHLVADNETAKEANEQLIEEITNLGATQATSGEGDDAVGLKFKSNGFADYTLNSAKTTSATYREMGVANLFANYGDDYVADLIAAGALDDSYDATLYPLSYTDENGEKYYYVDMMPDFSFLGINLLEQPSFSNNDTWRDWILLLIPLLVFLTSFLNHKLTMRSQPQQTGPDGNPQKPGMFMAVGMPLLSAVFTLMFPAAIGAYWVWRTLISMLKTPILNKLYPIPRYTQEELDAAAREMAAKNKGKKKKFITIEVDEDDNTYSDIEVKGQEAPAPRVETARPKNDGKKTRSELPYRKPTNIEMLSADDEDGTSEET